MTGARDRTLLVIGPVVERPTAAPARRLRAFTDAARASGFEVTVLWDGDRGASRRRRLTTRLLRRGCDNTTPAVLRVGFEIAAGVLSLLALAARRPSHAIVSIPYVPLALATFGRRRGSEVVVDVRDLTWEYLHAGVAGRTSRVLAHGYEVIARAALRRGDRATCTNELQRTHLRAAFGVDATVVTNGVDPDVRDALATVRPQLEDREEIRLLYAGTLGYAQAPLRLLELLDVSERITVHFVGAGPLQRDIRLAAESSDRVSFSPPVDFPVLVEEYSAADVLVACLAPDDAFATAIPSKLFEYAASRKPLLFVGPEPVRDAVEELGGMFATSPDRALGRQIEERVAAVRSGTWQPSQAAIPDRADAARRLIAELR